MMEHRLSEWQGTAHAEGDDGSITVLQLRKAENEKEIWVIQGTGGRKLLREQSVLNRKNRAAKCNYNPSTGVVSVTEPMAVKVLGI